MKLIVPLVKSAIKNFTMHVKFVKEQLKPINGSEEAELRVAHIVGNFVFLTKPINRF